MPLSATQLPGRLEDLIDLPQPELGSADWCKWAAMAIVILAGEVQRLRVKNDGISQILAA